MSEKTELKIDWATHQAAKYACEHWHYSKCMPVGKIVKIGAWESDQFIGVVLFSRGANKSIGTPFGLDQTEVCELTRVALTKHKNTVSKILSIAIRFLKQSNPGLKMIISFADPDQNHYGGIYQAGNWIYNGMSASPDEYLYEGKRWHGRAFRKSHGSHLKYIDKGLTIVKGSSKHRYLYPLDQTLKTQLKPLSKLYPKRATKANSDDQSESGGAIPTCTLQSSEVA